MRSKAVLVCAGVILLATGIAEACGPFFDDAYLVRGSEQEFLSMPEGDFQYELEKISGKKSQPQAHEKADGDTPGLEYDVMRTKTADADINDLKEAMKLSKAPDQQKEDVVRAYSERRSKITEYLRNNIPASAWTWYGDQFRNPEKNSVKLKMSANSNGAAINLIPREFVLYSEAAVDYHNNRYTVAIKKWQELLGLPQDQRKYKSVWAAFMIGKSYLNMCKAKESIQYFEMTRVLASEGYKDSLGLAEESYGWQALAEYETCQYSAAIKHYLKRMDKQSLYCVCKAVADLNDRAFDEVVKDETALKVLIGWTVSHSSYYYYSNDDNCDYIRIAKRLTSTIEKKGLTVPADNADRIAWMLYNLGEFKKADTWLGVSKENSALAQWLRAKLLIREGRVDEALKIMRQLKHAFAKDEEFGRFYGKVGEDVERKINTEHSVLLLHRNEYIMAFDILLQGAYWEDIAYVAEKVLTIEELEAYLKSHEIPGDAKALGFCYATNVDSPSVKKALEYLLARRLVRKGELQKALLYLPASFAEEEYAYNSERSGEKFSPKGKLQEYIDLLEKAKDQALSKNERAVNYFKAAILIRKYGMELMGTELDPDWFVFNGGFDYDRTIENRFALLTKEREDYYKGWYDERIKDIKKERKKLLRDRAVFYGSKEEEGRVLKSMPDPNKRYHYRYKAADLMWKCAELLPDNDGLKAQALCLGGTYLKNRDIEEADKFYKALVKTCLNTKLGQEACRKRWFPDPTEGM
jgi:hypothetical protein